MATVFAVLAVIGTGSASAALPSDLAGVPFATFAHARSVGNYSLACDQIATATLIRDPVPGSSDRVAGLKVCARALRSVDKHLDEAHRRRLASTRVVLVLVSAGRARVTVQTVLFGVHPRATGTSVFEDGRWRIERLPSGAHVGSSLVEQVPSDGMVPTLHVGDTILYNQAAYRHAAPRIGDIVVFHPPLGALRSRCGKRPPAGQACAIATQAGSTVDFVKRIVAGPGDRISIRAGHLIRNGRRQVEDFITPCRRGAGCDFPRMFTVPAGGYYLLGDNRGKSDDSRFWGPVPATAIVGRVRRLGP